MAAANARFYGQNISLPSLDSLFSSEEERQDAKLERVQLIPLEQLHPFRRHPFRVEEDEELLELARSLQQYGVLTPALARLRPDGGYELVSGHRRHRAAMLAGLETLPVVVRELDDDAAVIAMVDANQQRERLLPSEKGWAYRMKLEAIKHQGKRLSCTSGQIGQKPGQVSRDLIAENAPDSSKQIQRYIRLTHLIQPLLDMVDEGQIALSPAVELSYLTREQQEFVYDAIQTHQATPSHAQAIRLKNLSRAKQLTMDTIYQILSDEKPNQTERLHFRADEFRKYFPRHYTVPQMEKEICELLEARRRQRQKQAAPER